MQLDALGGSIDDLLMLAPFPDVLTIPPLPEPNDHRQKTEGD